MSPMRLDRIGKLLANRRLSRRQALAAGSAGVATTALAVLAFVASGQSGNPVPSRPRHGSGCRRSGGPAVRFGR
jgi:hypothetical protein